MKTLKPSVEFIENDNVFKKIELVGRISYKSEDKITEDSAKKFVKMLEEKGHGAPLEHGIIYLVLNLSNPFKRKFVEFFESNPYSTVVISDNHAYITTNYRVVFENKLFEVMDWLSTRTELHVQMFTFKFICSRAIANEFVRHRKFSFMQESTRYCNYSKDKFNNEITCIEPTLLTEDNYRIWKEAMENAEKSYMDLVKNEAPQIARGVLPLDLKTELVMTGSLKDWADFLKLRSTKMNAKGVHPDAAYLADKVFDKIFV